LKTMAVKLYEGMFLVDTALAASDWDGVNDFIRGILEKAGAEILSMKKWDDRKLAYDIAGKNRGTYVLVFFKVGGGKIREIERSVQLSEKVMRVLILNIDEMGPEHMEKPTPAMVAEQTGTSVSQQPQSNEEEDDTSLGIDEIGEIPSIDALDDIDEKQ